MPGKHAVDFHRDQSTDSFDQDPGKNAKARANLENFVLGAEFGCFSHRQTDALIGEK